MTQSLKWKPGPFPSNKLPAMHFQSPSNFSKKRTRNHSTTTITLIRKQNLYPKSQSSISQKKMSESNYQEDLDLLLSLPDRVLETPPASPSSRKPGKWTTHVCGLLQLMPYKSVIESCSFLFELNGSQYMESSHRKLNSHWHFTGN